MQTKKAFRNINSFSRKKQGRYSSVRRFSNLSSFRSGKSVNFFTLCSKKSRSNRVKRKEKPISRDLRRKNVGGHSHGTESLDITKKTILGRFYMNGCVYCIKMNEQWKELLEDPDIKNNVQVFDIESKHQDTFVKIISEKIKQGIFKDLKPSYPTIFKINVEHGRIDYYMKKRTKDGMKDWVLQTNGDKPMGS